MNSMNKMRSIHPGEVLREEFLVPLGMSAHALALELKVPAPRINDIVRERRAVTPDTALRLARFFGTTPQFWLNLQTSFDLKNVEQAIGAKIEREVHAWRVGIAEPLAGVQQFSLIDSYRGYVIF